jgi:uncharacterized protein YbjT (DUF2867 family)
MHWWNGGRGRILVLVAPQHTNEANQQPIGGHAMYAIAGVTGHTGKIAAETLLAQGKAVRVIVRKAEQGAAWKAKGAEVAVASLDDEAALTKAFTGAEGAYVLLPPDVTSNEVLASRARLTKAISAAVQAAKLPHVVLLSSVGAQLPDGTGPIKMLHDAEKSLEKTGAATTFVRASYFLENFGGVLQPAKTDGVLPSFMPAGMVHETVTTRDIGRTVAQALVDGPRGRRVIELAGAAPTSANDVAAKLTKLLGRPVKVAEAPLEAVVPTFMSFGMSQNMSELYREMIAGFNSGHIKPDHPDQLVRGQVGVEEGLKELLG